MLLMSAIIIQVGSSLEYIYKKTKKNSAQELALYVNRELRALTCLIQQNLACLHKAAGLSALYHDCPYHLYLSIMMSFRYSLENRRSRFQGFDVIKERVIFFFS